MQRFARLPNELLDSILSQLSGNDVKNLRLTSRTAARAVPLHLDRVFLSANPRDIEVFRAVADHDTFRSGVKEIIWDIALLENRLKSPKKQEIDDDPDSESDSDCQLDDQEQSLCNDCGHDIRSHGDTDANANANTNTNASVMPTNPPKTFKLACDQSLQDIERRKFLDAGLPHHVVREAQAEAQLPLAECWKYYRQLLLQQEETLERNLDVQSFEYGLKRFKSLIRVTITPAAHGYLFIPLYKTPMIRAFPYGFNYLIPRTWPMTGGRLGAPEWENAAKTNAYRGFGETLASLAAHKHSSVIELVVDVNQLLTGVSCHVFDEQCKEYDDLVTLLQTPRFRRLDLALTVVRAYTDEWQSFRNGRLRNALAQATGMEHMHLRTDITGDPDFNAAEPGSGGRLYHFIPLHSIFPIEKWPRLRHFGLSGFVVTQDDVYNFLKDLPPTVRTVELSFLHFLDISGGYAELLKALRDTLRWQDRPEDQRIALIIGLDTQHGNDCEGRAVWIEKEVADFLYNNGRNPFADEDGTVWKTVIQDCAGTVRDAFVPEHERPWALPQTLVALGIHKDPFVGHHIELPSCYTHTWLRVRTSAI